MQAANGHRPLFIASLTSWHKWALVTEHPLPRDCALLTASTQGLGKSPSSPRMRRSPFWDREVVLNRLGTIMVTASLSIPSIAHEISQSTNLVVEYGIMGLAAKVRRQLFTAPPIALLMPDGLSVA